MNGAPRIAMLSLEESRRAAATDDILEQGVISAETWLRCAQHAGGDEALLELVAAIGTWRMISSLLRSLEIPLEQGVAPWPPDGISPERSRPGPASGGRAAARGPAGRDSG